MEAVPEESPRIRPFQSCNTKPTSPVLQAVPLPLPTRRQKRSINTNVFSLWVQSPCSFFFCHCRGIKETH